jgi:hypothetical protein
MATASLWWLDTKGALSVLLAAAPRHRIMTERLTAVGLEVWDHGAGRWVSGEACFLPQGPPPPDLTCGGLGSNLALS